MGGIVDAVSDIGTGFIDSVSDIGSGFVDTVSDIGTSTINTFSDIGSGFIDTASDIGQDVLDISTDIAKPVWDDVLHPLYDFGVDLTFDFIEYTTIRPLDFVLDSVGVHDQLDFLYNLNEGMRWIGHGIGDGDWNAIKAGAMIAAAVALAVVSLGTLTEVSIQLTGIALALGAESATALTAIYLTAYAALVVSTIYSLYGIIVAVADIGNFIRHPSQLLAMASKARDALNLAFTNSWINGSMNMWMAGGVLYDSPRAGDLKFHPTGNLNTTKFLNMQDMNGSTMMDWDSGRYAEFNKKTFGNLAGDTFFSVSPMTNMV